MAEEFQVNPKEKMYASYFDSHCLCQTEQLTFNSPVKVYPSKHCPIHGKNNKDAEKVLVKESYNPKKYFDSGATIIAKTSLTPDQMNRLRSGEVFTVLKEDGTYDRRIMMDSWDVIRCGPVDNSKHNILAIMFGVPQSPYASKP